MEWIFSGIGTAFVTFLLGILVGVGASNYYFKNKISQSQKAGDNANQIQIGGDNYGNFKQRSKSKGRK